MIAAAGKNLIDLVKQIVLGRIAADRLVLPAMPANATRCIAMVRDPDINMRQVASTLSRDPMLTAQVLRLANSAAYAGTGAVKSIDQAVTRVGAQKLKTLLIEVSARLVFDSRDPRIAEAFRGIWDHSIAVGLLAREVSTLATGSDPDATYLAGLLHDVGKPVVAAVLLEAEKTIGAGSAGAWIKHRAWVAAVQETHRTVGAAIAEKWHLPEAVVSCIRDCHEYDTNERLSTPNVVRFANALAKKAGVYVGDVDTEDTDALVMIGRSLLGLDEDVIERLSRDLPERVKQQMA